MFRKLGFETCKVNYDSHDMFLTKKYQNFFVPFVAHPCSTKVIWKNHSVRLSEGDLDSVSYRVRNGRVGGCHGEGGVKRSIFYAERYGGGAISTHGGGARSGCNGRFLVKGIGLTPLAGIQASIGHRDGKLTLSAALSEVLWSCLLAEVVHWGVVEPIAVLKIRGADTIDGENINPMALFVRRPVVRIGHFCRAPLYRPDPSLAVGVSHDIERVKGGMKLIGRLLPKPMGCDRKEFDEMPPDERLILSMEELAKRLGQQMGVCAALHLMPMTSPSNCTIDGRLLDFNSVISIFPPSVETLSEKYILTRRLSEDQKILEGGLIELCLNAGKYLYGRGFFERSVPIVLSSYRNNLSKELYLKTLELVGFDRGVLLKGWGDGSVAAVSSFVLDRVYRNMVFRRSTDIVGNMGDIGLLDLLSADLSVNYGDKAFDHSAASLRFLSVFEGLRRLVGLEMDGKKSESLDMLQVQERICRRSEVSFGDRKALRYNVIHGELSNAIDEFSGDCRSLSKWFGEYIDYKKSIFMKMNRPGFRGGSNF